MSAAQQRRLSRALRLLVLLAFTLATLSSTGTASAGAAAYGYDDLASHSAKAQRGLLLVSGTRSTRLGSRRSRP